MIYVSLVSGEIYGS
ncbi:hypothetical protein F383_39296 [Gossypium arboreum]|uniref:Uncharacterized protein n=1 Tax=Gossypium arboreum TaxID=29729 RepID=A0A0B0MM73_GOSAR|nr:hypothetical protein F383_39052 [Gossypium arboreum]KHG01830.1 hypothetical protein F383_39296 [Gossypium arboreum]